MSKKVQDIIAAKTAEKPTIEQIISAVKKHKLSNFIEHGIYQEYEDKNFHKDRHENRKLTSDELKKSLDFKKDNAKYRKESYDDLITTLVTLVGLRRSGEIDVEQEISSLKNFHITTTWDVSKKDLLQMVEETYDQLCGHAKGQSAAI